VLVLVLLLIWNGKRDRVERIMHEKLDSQLWHVSDLYGCLRETLPFIRILLYIDVALHPR